MRKRIAKRVRKDILRMGGQIVSVNYVSESGWLRKQCGYQVIASYNNKECWCLGYDLLEAYKLAVETIREIQNGDLDF